MSAKSADDRARVRANAARVLPCTTRDAWCLIAFVCSLMVVPSLARAQRYGGRVETWGDSYRPAGILSMEGRVHAYPWVVAETQVWTGRSPLAPQGNGDVVVLAVTAREPTGHADLRAGRFVLSTGAVRPIHVDGGHVRGRLDVGTQLELFGGVPVSPAITSRAYDWLLGGRASQRLGNVGALGVSYVERRDRGREVDEELGADFVLYPVRAWTVSGRTSFDLVSRGLSELHLSSSLGTIDTRIELFGLVRDPSLLLPATSLFSVLSDQKSLQTGLTGRWLAAPRLRLEALTAYRGAGGKHGANLRAIATLWLDDERQSAMVGTFTRDGVADGMFTGLRGQFYRDVLQGLRLSSELELVVPDTSRGRGRVWPWGRLAARYTLRDHWRLSVGVEGSSTPQFLRLIQALVALAFEAGTI